MANWVFDSPISIRFFLGGKVFPGAGVYLADTHPYSQKGYRDYHQQDLG